VTVTGTPIGIAPDGSAEGRDQMPVCDETPQIAIVLLPKAVGAAAGINEVPGGHPEDLKPEQPGNS
jgi:hypothetical protein